MQDRERRGGTGILFEEPNPTGSRPRDLIVLYKRWHQEEWFVLLVYYRVERKEGFNENTAMRHRPK